MRILIIEDEDNVASRLCNLIKKIVPEANILDIIESVEDAINWFSCNPHPDLIFMDIQLSDGLSFSIFEKTEKIKCPIIFTTAFDEYAIKAFEVNSIDYLLKPIYEDKLKRSLEKYESLKKQWVTNDFQQQLSTALGSISNNPLNFKSRFLIHRPDSLIVVPITDVAWFMANEKEVMLVSTKNERYILGQPLDKVEKQLDPKLFFRINRQFIISIGSIEKISNYFNYKLKIYLKPPAEQEIVVGRKKVPIFKQWLNN